MFIALRSVPKADQWSRRSHVPDSRLEITYDVTNTDDGYRAVRNELDECLALCSQNVDCNQILYRPERGQQLCNSSLNCGIGNLKDSMF